MVFHMLDILEQILNDHRRNSGRSWALFANQLAITWVESWRSVGYVPLSNIYFLLAKFCGPGSGYYSQIKDLLLRLSTEVQRRGILGDALLKLYVEMLEDTWRGRANDAMVMAKINAILASPIWTSSSGSEEADWRAVYKTFNAYLRMSNFYQAGQVQIPEFQGRVLTGVIYILRRIHGFPNGRGPNEESQRIKDMIEHLHEPERTILQVITRNW